MIYKGITILLVLVLRIASENERVLLCSNVGMLHLQCLETFF